jgi:lipoprotein-anchoring transpeptidase ErfK/SrfK
MSAIKQKTTTLRSRSAVLVFALLTLVTTGAAPRANTPAPSQPLLAAADSDGIAVYRAALRERGTKILVSTQKKWLWLIANSGDTLVSAPVAIGMGNTFTYNGKTTRFHTPVGKRTVRLKEENPLWTVPEWHYYEKAARKGLQVAELKLNQPYLLEDGSWLDIRTDTATGRPSVGRVNKGYWYGFQPNYEIEFDGKLFMPPQESIQRKVSEALGPYKLDMGEGYLIHGTHEYTENSIGQAASHGCVRMRNSDLMVLYFLVDAGTPVFIF